MGQRSMNEYIADFQSDLVFSLGERQQMDISLIKEAIPNCVHVEKTKEIMDRKGIDYIATLDGGAHINIDAKTRRRGASYEWRSKDDPTLALELWSVRPDKSNGIKGKVGWTCNRETEVDMILYTFDREEFDKFFLIPFQHLRIAFQKNFRDWSDRYPPRRQKNQGYESEAMFVPASVVLKAVVNEMIKRRNGDGEKWKLNS